MIPVYVFFGFALLMMGMNLFMMIKSVQKGDADHFFLDFFMFDYFLWGGLICWHGIHSTAHGVFYTIATTIMMVCELIALHDAVTKRLKLRVILDLLEIGGIVLGVIVMFR